MKELVKNPEETRESWQEQELKINSLGTVKEILNSKELLLQIITYHGDRHLINQFYDMLNEEIERGTITPEDMEILRSPWFSSCLVDLEVYLAASGRNAYNFEKADKLNYSTLIKDTETQISIFTNKRIINALAEIEPNQELTYFEQSIGYLSFETQIKIANEVIKAGNIEKGTKILEDAIYRIEYMRKYEEKERSSGMQR